MSACIACKRGAGRVATSQNLPTGSITSQRPHGRRLATYAERVTWRNETPFLDAHLHRVGSPENRIIEIQDRGRSFLHALHDTGI